ncbi:MAG: segregation/condensation protein A [Planctomycetes bacterium]|nr:segregation/condensation protein A [Planctomycetota bacterium]
MTDYKVQLENFYGPFDLLLYLVKEEELNIYDIPISRITDQYMSYLEMIKHLDINMASEFMVVAATLIEMKARSLMPRDEEEPEEDDPRFELVRKLIEYKKYKDLSKILSGLVQKQLQLYPRPSIKEEETPEEKPEPVVEIELWPLVKTFNRLTKETALETSLSIIYEDVPLERFMISILERLKDQAEMTFSVLTEHGKNKIITLKNFLAALELAKEQKITLNQESDFGEITIKLAPPSVPAVVPEANPVITPQAAQPQEPDAVKPAETPEAVPEGASQPVKEAESIPEIPDNPQIQTGQPE